MRLSRRLRLAASALLVVAGAALLAAGAIGQQAQPAGVAYAIEFSGTVDPASERWVTGALEDAAEAEADIAIIQLDTPGGLVDSTRNIVREIIAAPMPVVVYVSPDGAQAGSAGVFITQAGDVAAMAPQTNIGSATPVSIGVGDPGDEDDVMARKVTNDAAAWVRALAEEHGRDPDLAEATVRDAENFSASEAHRRGFVDVVARTPQELLDELDGFEVQGPKEQTLETDGLVVEEHEMPLHLEILQLLVNPNISYLLLLAGLAGIAIEIFNPGTLVPGTLGAISLLLGLYGTAQLPVAAVGIVLLVGGIGLIIAETQLPTGGVLGAGGVLGIVLSGLLLYDTGTGEFGVSPPVVIAAGVMIGGFILFAAQRVSAAHHEKIRTGWEELIGMEGTVRVPLDPVGQVFLDGALWRARAAGDESLPSGARVTVESVDGLTLNVIDASQKAATNPADAEPGAEEGVS